MMSLISKRLMPPLPVLETRISLVSANDVCQAIQLALSSSLAIGKTYTVTDGEDYKISDIEAAIYTQLGRKSPSWRTPRMILYAAAGLAGVLSTVLSKILGTGGGINSRTYRNLTQDNVFSNQALCTELGFTPTTTLYLQLAEILEQLSTNKT